MGNKEVKPWYENAAEKRLLNLNELEEISWGAYENSRIYNEKIKKWHDRKLLKKQFELRQLALLST